MSWSYKPEYTWFQRLCLNIIKAGPVPKHVAFIMDGNRRFARINNIPLASGHRQGYSSMSAVRRWCFDIGVQEITFYALSIENFKRNKNEVEYLLTLIKNAFKKMLCEQMQDVMADEARIRVIGDLSLLDDEFRNLIAQIMLTTKDNKKFFMNIAIAYTSRQEIKTAVSSILAGVEENIIIENNVTEQLISECLYTYNSSEPDLLLRTSGEVRLSDFLLWQTSKSLILFTNNLWPDFGVWRVIALVFYYQQYYKRVLDIKKIKMSPEMLYTESMSPKVQEFLNKLHQKQMKTLESYVQD